MRNALPAAAFFLAVALALTAGVSTAATTAEPAVKLWQEPLVIPTYRVGPPERNPIFYTGRKYQGAKGPVYPYPLLDKLSDVKEDKTYQAVYLENQYVKYCILPELGGRIFSATDKTNGYDFVYRQHVVKPALIGMCGAWISGGVEWNIPHHHRASTFMPVDCRTIDNPDGSRTVWLGEIELRHRMKWLVGLTLWPDRSYLEATVKLINRTPFAHSILYFANIAVHANKNYQVIFPPSTEFGTQHGKSEFVNWPVGQGRYGGLDRTGVDLSWWKNHPVPASIFAWNYDDDFFGGYDHGREAGIAIVADHHVSPGKKFFLWGDGPEARTWEKMLTDSDGPYLELMAGAWSDNQPDYSWIQPYETKTVKQYFYPIRGLGGMKKANLDAAVNLEVDEKGVARIAVNTTRAFAKAKVVLRAGETVIFEKKTTVAPEKPFRGEAMLPAKTALTDLALSVIDAIEPEIVGCRPITRKGAPMPKPVEPPPAPKDVKTVEELYMIGLRLEQFHSPAIEPYLYYEEALRRDPGDYRANTALGILYLKRGLYEEAIRHLNAAIERATRNYTSPKDGEAFYYLGVALKAQGKLDAAETALGKAAWSHACSAAAYYTLAEIAFHRSYQGTGNDELEKAIYFVSLSLSRNRENTKARALQSAALFVFGRDSEAKAAAEATLMVDPLDSWATDFARPVSATLELAADFAARGDWGEAYTILESDQTPRAHVHPLVRYHCARYREGDMSLEESVDATFEKRAALVQRAEAKKLPVDLVFPWQLESVDVLKRAMKADAKDARAPYYLGNLLYDIQPQNAIAAWEESRKRDDKFPIVHRNLALAYAHVEKNLPKAIASLERAIECDAKDPKYYAELDVLYEAANTPPEKRLALLEKNHDTVAQRDESLAREIELDILLGKHDRAIELLKNHHFHLWEGGAGMHGLWGDAHLLRGQARLKAKQYAEAVRDFQAALECPDNLETPRSYRGSGRLAQIAYWTGAAHEAAGEKAKARESFQQAAGTKNERSDLSFYQALASRKLGDEAKAKELLAGLVRFAQERLAATQEVDFFAKFGGRQSEAARKADAHYLLGLGLLGQGKQAEAQAEFQKALELNASHLGARNAEELFKSGP